MGPLLSALRALGFPRKSIVEDIGAGSDGWRKLTLLILCIIG